MNERHEQHDADSPDDAGEPTLPAALVADLTALYRPPSTLRAPSRVDDTVFRAAREHLAGVSALGAKTPLSQVGERLGEGDGSSDASSHRLHSEASDDSTLTPALSLSGRGRWRWALPWGLAAAAALAVAATVSITLIRTDAPRAAADPRDIDANGRVDILDAFALARRLEQPLGGVDPARVDVNGDGAVDAADVDAIAAAAVKLNGGRG
ncbi:MAG: hypothetical protein GC159_09195 [Phycisphaera sp.]|nr:hypothetical protein [Phycisphaera sp.]